MVEQADAEATEEDEGEEEEAEPITGNVPEPTIT